MDQLFGILGKLNRAAISFFTVLEFISAGRKLLKAGKIDSKDFEIMLANFLNLYPISLR